MERQGSINRVDADRTEVGAGTHDGLFVLGRCSRALVARSVLRAFRLENLQRIVSLRVDQQQSLVSHTGRADAPPALAQLKRVVMENATANLGS